METVFIVFMGFVSLICLFSVLVVTRDIVKEIVGRKQKKERVVEEPTPVPVAAATVEEPAVVEEEVIEPADTVDGEEKGIVFNPSASKTLDEKYLALSSKEKSWYDEIVKYAASIENSKRYKNARYEEYKLGKTSLVRLLIKRDVVNCQLIMYNRDFKNYLTENKLSIKPAPTTIKIDSDDDIKVVKDSIDIIVQFIADEKAYKKQLAKEKRKAKREEQEVA